MQGQFKINELKCIYKKIKFGGQEFYLDFDFHVCHPRKKMSAHTCFTKARCKVDVDWFDLSSLNNQHCHNFGFIINFVERSHQ